LLQFSGFPEPYYSQNLKEHSLWQRNRLSRVIREDLRDLELVKEISLLESLADAIPDRVGSLLSVENLRKDLQVNHKTIVRWLARLENLYFSFSIQPYNIPKIKSVQKSKKLICGTIVLLTTKAPDSKTLLLRTF